MCCKCLKYVREGARGGCGALSLLEVYIYIYIYSDREREMYNKCSKYVRESKREREEGVVRCHCLKYI